MAKMTPAELFSAALEGMAAQTPDYEPIRGQAAGYPIFYPTSYTDTGMIVIDMSQPMGLYEEEIWMMADEQFAIVEGYLLEQNAYAAWGKLEHVVFAWNTIWNPLRGRVSPEFVGNFVAGVRSTVSEVASALGAMSFTVGVSTTGVSMELQFQASVELKKDASGTPTERQAEEEG